MTFEKLLAEAMDMDSAFEDRVMALLDYYGCPDPEEESNYMINQFKEDNQ